MPALTAAIAAPEVAAGAADVAAITLPDVAVGALAPAAAEAGAAGVGAGELAAGGALAGAGGVAATDIAGATADLGTGIAPTLASALQAPGAGVPPLGTTPTVPGTLPSSAGVMGPPGVGAVAPPPGLPTGGINPIQSGFEGGDVGGGDLSAGAGGDSATGTNSFTANAGQNTATAGGANTGAGAPSSITGGESPIGGDFGGGGDSGSFSNFFKNPGFGTAGDVLSKNPWLVGAGGIGLSILRGNQTLPGQSGITSAANQLSTQGKQLEQYLQTGTLPPGVQGGIDQATKSAQAAIRSKYASMGSSGSSAEQEDINNVTQLAAAQGAQIAIQLLNTGISETGLSAQLYQYLLENSLSQDQALGTAISSFGASLVPRTVTVQNATTTA